MAVAVEAPARMCTNEFVTAVGAAGVATGVGAGVGVDVGLGVGVGVGDGLGAGLADRRTARSSVSRP